MGGWNGAAAVGMVTVQIAQVGLMIAAKVAMSNGMSSFAFTFYSNALASLVLLPFSLRAFIYYTRSTQPQPPLPLLRTFLCGFFVLGFLGFLVQILGYTGLKFASASLSTCMLNLIPGFTFVFAVIFRLEKFNHRSSATVAKSIGTLISVMGALILTLYQGSSILTSFRNLNTLTGSSAWLLGGLLLGIDAIVSSLFIIAQALVLKKCPTELVLMLFYSCFVAIFSAAASLVMDKDLNSAWSLNYRTKLIPVIYSGLFGNVFQVSIIMWCVKRRGPLFASLFHPLGVIFAITMGIVILGEALYLGRHECKLMQFIHVIPVNVVVGSIIVVVGFYSVMWGKAKEAEQGDEIDERRMPLLPH